MGKEVKIGLAFIMALLIVFGVVLTKRLIGPSDDTTASTGESKKNNTPSTKRKDAVPKVIEVAKPTVVAANLNNGPASRWSVVSDKDDAKSPQRDAADSSLPSYMPKPTTPASSSYAAQYGSKNLRREDGSYEVQPNDSYWTISQKLYGSGAYFKALAEHNRSRVPRENKLAVGDVISAPEVTELEETYPGLCLKPSRRQTARQRASTVSTISRYRGGRTYVVEEGDTLFDIARYELGNASRWVEIYELNRDRLGSDHDYLTPGLKLTLPSDTRTDRITSRPDTNSRL